jgi:N utilization substance protein B
MISRRQLRIKVLQILFEWNFDKEKSLPLLKKKLRENVNDVHELFIFHLYVIHQVCQYVNQYQLIQQSKLLTTEAEKNVNKKLLSNIYYLNLENSEYFQDKVKKYKLKEKLNPDLIKTIFYDLIERKGYRKYLKTEDPEKKIARDNLMMQEIYLELMLLNDYFNDECEKWYPCWNDDYNLVSGYVIGFLKNMPSISNYIVTIDNNIDEEDIIFGEQLLSICITNFDTFKNTLSKVLSNWDVDRIGTVEKLLLYLIMGELQYLQTPDKITFNEYIEIAKIYAGEKSHEFINGVIDKLIQAKEVEY